MAIVWIAGARIEMLIDPPYRLDPLQTILSVEWGTKGSSGGKPLPCTVTPYIWGTYIAVTIKEFNILGPNFPFDTTPIMPGFDWWEGGEDGMSHVFVTFGYSELGEPNCLWSFGGCDPLGAASHSECFAGTGDPATSGTATSPPTSSGRDAVTTVGPGSNWGGYNW